MKRIVQYSQTEADEVHIGQKALLLCVIDHPNIQPGGPAITSQVKRVWHNEKGGLDIETENTIFHAVVKN